MVRYYTQQIIMSTHKTNIYINKNTTTIVLKQSSTVIVLFSIIVFLLVIHNTKHISIIYINTTVCVSNTYMILIYIYIIVVNQ